MKPVISNHNHQTNTNKLIGKISRLKKIISVINYLNKEFKKNIIPQLIKNTLLLKK